MVNSKAETPILRIENLTKSFGTFVANDHVSFDVQKGHIHCLLGENGAGKSTLAKCIYGASRPDSGKMIFKGQEVKFSSPRDAIRMGIGMVHQHFVLAEPMNAIENIIVAEEFHRGAAQPSGRKEASPGVVRSIRRRTGS